MELVEKKGFKRTEVGLIPEDWIVLPQKDAVKYINGRAYSITEWEKTGIPVVRLQNLTQRGGRFYYSNLNLPEHQYMYNGDLIFMWSASFGPFIWWGDKAIFHYHIWKIKCDNQITDKKFYYHKLVQLTEELKKSTSGSTMLHLTKGAMEKYLFALPPTLEEQQAIATALSDVDALISNLDTLITKKKAIKQGAMQQLLTPNDTWKRTSLIELAENKKSNFDDGDWVESEYIISQGVRLIQTGNIGIGKFKDKGTKKYISENSFSKLNCKEVLEGDLLVCRLAEPAGRACIMPNIGEYKVITSVDVSIFRGDLTIVNRVFLSQLFTTNNWLQKVIEKVGGTTHKRISRGSLGKIEIDVPNIKEQNKISQILTDMDSEIEHLETKKVKCQSIKQGMMQELLTGKTRLV